MADTEGFRLMEAGYNDGNEGCAEKGGRCVSAY
jgi:hypothetical protein